VSVCGLWDSTRRVVAVIIDDDGKPRPPITVPARASNTQHLLTYLGAIDIGTLILAERTHTLIDQALGLKLAVRLVPHDLLDAIRTAVGLNHRPPRDTAMLLARWYLTPTLRVHLREFRAPPIPEQQLALF
jgi:hypothetical protein